jgi:hypothetical protein
MKRLTLAKIHRFITPGDQLWVYVLIQQKLNPGDLYKI